MGFFNYSALESSWWGGVVVNIPTNFIKLAEAGSTARWGWIKKIRRNENIGYKLSVTFSTERIKL